MTKRIQEPVMDPYEFLDDGYSRLDHMDGLGRQPDIAAMNLHDAAEYRATEAKKAHPHYKRHGQIDIVTGEWHSYTAEELADLAFERKWRRLLFTLYGACVLAGVVAVVLVILQQKGVLS